MPRSSRRTFLTAAGGLLLASALPSPGFAGVLDRLLGQPEPKATKPITSNDEFYVTSYRSPPTIRINDWSLSIKGLVERPFMLNYAQLTAKPEVSQIVTLECVGNTIAGEFISTANWEGVPLNSLLEEAGVSATAYAVAFRAADGFSDSIPFDRAMAGDVLLAHRMNGVPLPQGHGFPARVIVPGHYGMKSVQWLTEIEVLDRVYKGYYQQKGWTEAAIVKTMSRIDLPGHGTTIRGLHQRIQGLAFAGIRGIRLVEISVDGGEQWMSATLDPPTAHAAWRFWSYAWTVPMSGRHALVVRATDGSGKIQTHIYVRESPVLLSDVVRCSWFSVVAEAWLSVGTAVQIVAPFCRSMGFVRLHVFVPPLMVGTGHLDPRNLDVAIAWTLHFWNTGI